MFHSEQRGASLRASCVAAQGRGPAPLGAPHVLTRTINQGSTEMSLRVLACNMKRSIAMSGIGPLLEAIQPNSAG